MLEVPVQAVVDMPEKAGGEEGQGPPGEQRHVPELLVTLWTEEGLDVRGRVWPGARIDRLSVRMPARSLCLYSNTEEKE